MSEQILLALTYNGMTLDPNNVHARQPGLQGTPSELVPCLLLSLKTLYKLGYMENANLRLQATPLENPGPVQGATPPSGDMEVPKVPRNLTININ